MHYDSTTKMLALLERDPSSTASFRRFSYTATDIGKRCLELKPCSKTKNITAEVASLVHTLQIDVEIYLNENNTISAVEELEETCAMLPEKTHVVCFIVEQPDAKGKDADHRAKPSELSELKAL